MATTTTSPLPALTPAQRYHLDLHGYVVVPGVLSANECGVIRAALDRMTRDARAGVKGPGKAVALTDLPHHVYLSGIVEAEPAATAYATHPRLVGMVEEAMGNQARIVEIGAHINHRDRSGPVVERPTYGFHRGTDILTGSHVKDGLYHCNFVKTLTTLGELGPDDGGTVVIPGSHRCDVPEKDLIDLAHAERSLIHQMTGPAGSTLVFFETTIHATGSIRSDRERAIIIGGYATSQYPYWDAGTLSAPFLASVPEHLRTMFHGHHHWTRQPRYRTLAQQVEPATATLADGWWPARAAAAAQKS